MKTLTYFLIFVIALLTAGFIPVGIDNSPYGMNTATPANRETTVAPSFSSANVPSSLDAESTSYFPTVEPSPVYPWNAPTMQPTQDLSPDVIEPWESTPYIYTPPPPFEVATLQTSHQGLGLTGEDALIIYNVILTMLLAGFGLGLYKSTPSKTLTVFLDLTDKGLGLLKQYAETTPSKMDDKVVQGAQEIANTIRYGTGAPDGSDRGGDNTVPLDPTKFPNG